MQIDWHNAMERATHHSPYLSLAMQRLPDVTSLLKAGDGEGALALAKSLGEGDADIGSMLRRQRLALSLALGIGDLAGAFPLLKVTGELSEYADYALDKAITAAIAKRVPDADPAGFAAIALGKQGADELNYSSDIDPILIFDPETLPRREKDEPGEAAQRYARTLVELLSHQTADGYVFRVDLRLRPASEVSPPALPIATAITHYESSALAWERAAYIRARAAGGDIELGQGFLDHLRPFVWRKSLDFTAIEEIRRLTARIRQAYEGPTKPGPGFDLKRGRGGIREIEFFAQTHQLIYGGRRPSLRVRGTRASLDALAAEEIISAEDAATLGNAYDRLRQVEHRLQMVDDRQTHELPQKPEALDNVAQLDGLADGAALIADLQNVCGPVEALYTGLLGQDEPSAKPQGIEVAEQSLSADFVKRVNSWEENIWALRGSEARIALQAILPDLQEAFASAPDPGRALTRWESFLEKLPTAINLFRLFEQRPGLLGQVLRVLTLARPLADELSRRPELLDALIDSSAFDLPESREVLAARMAASEDDDYESRLDHIRQVVGEERFALGLQLLEGRQDPLAISEGLCRVAEAALEVAANAAIEEFQSKHGRIGESEMLVLGLGRFGGGALTHASDLDIIYLFDGEVGQESDGPRPLSTSLYFNRLATRVTAAMSVPTAEGALYEVDTRLRPQGNQGPLAVSLESFEKYQREDAWTWEHMALCRSRPLFGSEAAKAKIQSIARSVLETKRDPEKLKADVLKMRNGMAQHKSPKGPLDAKLLRGGLVDCEFLVHYLQLRENVALVPALEKAMGGLASAGHLPPEFTQHFETITRLLVSARLLAPDSKHPPEAAKLALARACGVKDYDDLLHKFTEARHAIASQWAEHFGEELEIE